jgi:hypothetical protein
MYKNISALYNKREDHLSFLYSFSKRESVFVCVFGCVFISVVYIYICVCVCVCVCVCLNDKIQSIQWNVMIYQLIESLFSEKKNSNNSKRTRKERIGILWKGRNFAHTTQKRRGWRTNIRYKLLIDFLFELK